MFFDDYEVAGFVFHRIDGKICPINSFQSSATSKSLSQVFTRINEESGANWAVVPRVLTGEANSAEKKANFLFQEIPSPPFNKRLRTDLPPLSLALLARNKGLNEGSLDESYYPASKKLAEKINQVCPTNPPSAYIWAYMLGVYDLVRAASIW